MDPRLEAGLAAIDAAIGVTADPARDLVAAKCRALLVGYHARWQDAPWAVEEVEQMVDSDLWNPETGRKSRSFMVAAKLDLKVLVGDRRTLVDHKTSSDDISDPNSTYWRQLIVEGQPSHYMLMEWLNGRKVDETVWDVVRKPSISPKAITKAEVKAAIMTRDYCGRRISDASVLALQESGRETLEMYEARLAQDCTTIRPEWYFQRRTVPRLDSEIHEYAVELWEHGQEMLHVLNTERHARNSGACMNYNRPCEFLGICSGSDTADSDKWRRKSNVHAELSGLVGDGRDVLTNSRIRCFQTCRRKHYFQYVLGIERAEEEDVDARYFGTVWHAGQQGYFEKQKELQNGNDASGAPVNEIGIANTEPATAVPCEQ